MEGERARLTEVNPYLVCVLCHGYLVDATTIAECLHSFCRSCIFRQLERKPICPICETPIHTTKIHRSLRPDKTLQDIVYKLVPGLFHNEMKRRRHFYKNHPFRDEHLEPECRGVGLDRLIYSPDDMISLSLEFYDEEREREEWSNQDSPKPAQTAPSGPKRYLKCPAGFKMRHLKKFLRQKYGLTDTFNIDILYKRETLPDTYSLMDVAYIYTWKRNSPMRFYYKMPEVVMKQLMTPPPEVPLILNEDSDSRKEKPEAGKDKTEETAVPKRQDINENKENEAENVPSTPELQAEANKPEEEAKTPEEKLDAPETPKAETKIPLNTQNGEAASMKPEDSANTRVPQGQTKVDEKNADHKFLVPLVPTKNGIIDKKINGKGSPKSIIVGKTGAEPTDGKTMNQPAPIDVKKEPTLVDVKKELSSQTLLDPLQQQQVFQKQKQLQIQKNAYYQKHIKLQQMKLKVLQANQHKQQQLQLKQQQLAQQKQQIQQIIQQHQIQNQLQQQQLQQFHQQHLQQLQSQQQLHAQQPIHLIQQMVQPQQIPIVQQVLQVQPQMQTLVQQQPVPIAPAPLQIITQKPPPIRIPTSIPLETVRKSSPKLKKPLEPRVNSNVQQRSLSSINQLSPSNPKPPLVQEVPVCKSPLLTVPSVTPPNSSSPQSLRPTPPPRVTPPPAAPPTTQATPPPPPPPTPQNTSTPPPPIPPTISQVPPSISPAAIAQPSSQSPKPTSPKKSSGTQVTPPQITPENAEQKATSSLPMLPVTKFDQTNFNIMTGANSTLKSKTNNVQTPKTWWPEAPNVDTPSINSQQPPTKTPQVTLNTSNGSLTIMAQPKNTQNVSPPVVKVPETPVAINSPTTEAPRPQGIHQNLPTVLPNSPLVNGKALQKTVPQKNISGQRLNNNVPDLKNGLIPQSNINNRLPTFQKTPIARKPIPGGVLSKTGPTLDQRIQQLYNSGPTSKPSSPANGPKTGSRLANWLNNRFKPPQSPKEVEPSADPPKSEVSVVRYKRKLQELQKDCEITQENPRPDDPKRRREVLPDVSIKLMKAADMKKLEGTKKEKRPVPGLKSIQEVGGKRKKEEDSALDLTSAKPADGVMPQLPWLVSRPPHFSPRPT